MTMPAVMRCNNADKFRRESAVRLHLLNIWQMHTPSDYSLSGKELEALHSRVQDVVNYSYVHRDLRSRMRAAV